jgi:O-antigen/teichoic acid export membrane protein
MKDLNRKMAKGAAWMVLMRLTDRGLGLISTVILARLLIPADFGLVAMAMSIIAILEILGSFSFDLALIQNQSAERRHYDTAWTFTVLYNTISAIILVALAEPASVFYSDQRLVGIIYVMALSSIVQGFENIGLVAFQKDLDLSKEFLFRTAKKIVAFTVTISLALIYKNYWALVVGTLAGRIAGLIFSYLAHPYRPRFTLEGRNELFHFSKWTLANNIIIFVAIRGIDFVIGRVSGSAALGLYTIAYEVSNLPTTELVFPIGRAVYPGYAKMAHDLSILRQGYLDVLGAIVFFAIPAAMGILVLADPMVMVVLGKNWLEAIPLIQVLAVFGMIRACNSNSGSIYMVIGHPKLISIITLFYITLLIPLLIWLVPQMGPLGAAWAITITVLVQFPINQILLSHYLKIRFLAFIGIIWRPLLAGLLMAWGVDATRTFISSPLHQIDPVWLNNLRKFTSTTQFRESIDLILLGMDSIIHNSALINAINLFLLVLLGMIFYTVTVYLLWFISRRPDGSESIVLRLVLSRIFKSNK